MASFAERIARHIDRPVDAACAVRPPATTMTVAAGAGLGAAVGSIVGGSPIAAGVGGGLGVVAAYLAIWLMTRGSGLAVGMALVLEPERVELLRMNAFGTRPTGTVRSIPYADIRGLEARDRLLELIVEIRTVEDTLRLAGGRRGVGAAPPVIEELRRRT
jgi:hypothetical protein